MKLSDYAKYQGVSYKTAWRWWKTGKLPHPARQVESGTVIVDFQPEVKSLDHRELRVAIYARVSSKENKDNLDRQAEKLTQYATFRGYSIFKVVKEIGNGLNDNREKLNDLLSSDGYDILIVEHRERLARFESQCIDVLLKRLNVRLEIVNESDNGTDELMEDLIIIIKSFSARLYGQRRSKRKIEKIIEELNNNEDA